MPAAREGISDQLNAGHPGESREPVTFVQRTEMQRHRVPDIASRFRDDEQNQSFPGTQRSNIACEFGSDIFRGGERLRNVLARVRG